MAFIFLIPGVHAATINSTTFKTIMVVDAAGGFSNSTNFRSVYTVDGVLGSSSSTSNKLCVGYLCFEVGAEGEVTVTFLLETNLSGTSNDQAFVSVDNTTGLYRANQITKFYTCIQDTSLADSPVIGIIFAGTNFNYARLDNGTSFAMRVSQAQAGNRFVVPFTSGGCTTISNNYPITLTVVPFVPTSDVINAVEMLINYPINIVGSFERTGSFTLILERNETDIIGTPA